MIDLKYVIWLSHLYDVSAANMDYILARYGSAEEIYKVRPETLQADKRIPSSFAERIIKLRKTVDPDAVKENMDKLGIGLVSKFDEDFPPLLKEIDNPPLGLYYRGKFPDYEQLWISVIGTRKPTVYGRDAAFNLSKDMAHKGAVIVSGMAEGLDAEAHSGALAAEGLTVAVLGSGADICYPKINRALYNAIIEKGLILSEYPPGTWPKPWHFPMRNRIISGLGHAVLVVEAGIRSGTLITADHALNQGREVFAVPGNITSPESAGTNALIKDGAHVALGASDIFDALGFIEDEAYEPVKSNKMMVAEATAIDIDKLSLAPEEKSVYALLGKEPKELEYIIEESGLSYQVVSFALTNLELLGKIKKLPGQRYTI